MLRIATIVFALLATTASDSAGLAREKRTLYDIAAGATACEAYATDYGGYPKASTMAELRPLVSPAYIETLPLRDDWGTELRYFVSADLRHYRFVSAGPDRKFDPSSLGVGKTPAKSDDFVYEDGRFLQAPAWIMREQE